MSMEYPQDYKCNTMRQLWLYRLLNENLKTHGNVHPLILMTQSISNIPQYPLRTAQGTESEI